MGVGVGVCVRMRHYDFLHRHPTTAAMCVLFVDIFAGPVFQCILGHIQTHAKL